MNIKYWDNNYNKIFFWYVKLLINQNINLLKTNFSLQTHEITRFINIVLSLTIQKAHLIVVVVQ